MFYKTVLYQKSLTITLTTLCFLIVAPLACAHAVVTHSSLNVQKIAPNRAEQVKLTFNSKVELDLSQIFLVSAGDKMQLVKASHSDKPGQVIIDLPPLVPGEYALKLSIFAADGHLSEDLVRFYVTGESN